MGKIWATAALVAMTLAGAADATVMRGTFSGTILSGRAEGAFGYTTQTNVAGQAISGRFTYDTDAFTGRCDGGNIWFQCFRAPGAVTIVQVVNGFEEVFISTPPAPGAPSYNVGDGGVAHYTLQGEDLEFAARSLRGTPSGQFDQYETRIGVELLGRPSGVDVVADARPTYDGPARSGGAGSLGPVFNQLPINFTRVLALTGGDLTKNTDFSFDISYFSISAVPEPASWAMLIAGFALTGGALRRRRAGAAYA